MSRAVWIGLLAGLALIAGLAWLFYGGDDDDSASGPVTIVDYTDSEAESADEEGDGRRAPPRYPLLEEPSESESEAVESKPLPELEASDESVREEASALSGAEPLESLLLPERLIERFSPQRRRDDVPLPPTVGISSPPMDPSLASHPLACFFCVDKTRAQACWRHNLATKK